MLALWRSNAFLESKVGDVHPVIQDANRKASRPKTKCALVTISHSNVDRFNVSGRRFEIA